MKTDESHAAVPRRKITFALDLIVTIAMAVAAGLLIWRHSPGVTKTVQTDEPPVVDISASGLSTIPSGQGRGVPHAPIVIVEFSDYECPFCARYAIDTFPKIEASYIDTGLVQYFVQDFPLEHIHPNALKAAQVAECASAGGYFWEMRSFLFAHQKELANAPWLRFDPIDSDSLNRCVVMRDDARIRRDIVEATRLGITSTPTLLIGQRNGDERTVRLLKRIRGSRPYEVFRTTLDAM